MIIIAHLDKLLKRLHFLGAILFFVFVPPLVGIWIYWAADRAPPFEILPHLPIKVHAGEWAQLVVPVRRDVSRNCSASWDRYIFPSQRGNSVNGRFDLGSGSMGPDGIRDLQERLPNQLAINVLIPPLAGPGRAGITEGPAEFISELEYVCNPTHRLKPIQVRTTIHLEIEAP